jgi:hypothetical protein
MEPQPRPDQELRGGQIAAAVLTFKVLLGTQEFEPLEGEAVSTISREKEVDLQRDRVAFISEMKKNLGIAEISTYNLCLYSLIGNTGMAEVRYYHMEPSSKQMNVIFAVVNNEEGEEVAEDQAVSRYKTQRNQEIARATEQDWEEFFSLIQEVRENETS